MKNTLVVLFSSTLMALPIDNPIAPSLAYNGVLFQAHYAMFGDPLVHCYQAWSLRAGFYGITTFNRHLINKHLGRVNIDRFSINTSAGTFVWNLYDMLDIFSTFGVSSYRFQTSGHSLGSAHPEQRITAHSSSNQSYSLGVRYNILEFASIVLGAEAQIFRCKAPITQLQYGTSVVHPDNATGIYDEWQYGLAIGYRLVTFYPYVGMKFSKVRINFDNYKMPDDIILNRFKQSKHVGYSVGASLLDCDKLFMTIEGIFGDEKAVYYGAQIRF